MEHGRHTAGHALMMRRMVWIAIALILADLATTLVAVRHVGAGVEANVLFRGLIARHGMATFAVTYLAVTGMLVSCSRSPSISWSASSPFWRSYF